MKELLVVLALLAAEPAWYVVKLNTDKVVAGPFFTLDDCEGVRKGFDRIQDGTYGCRWLEPKEE